MHQVIGVCPICGGELHVTRLHCGACETTIEGEFTLGDSYRLNRDQLQFLDVFIKNRGSLKDTGAELCISYPTVTNRLNDILITLGYADRVKSADDAPPTAEQRRDILERLARGEISADEAARLLRSKAGAER